MKVTGKLTKTEWLLLGLAAAFLAVLAMLYLDASSAARGVDYTISTQRRGPQSGVPGLTDTPGDMPADMPESPPADDGAEGPELVDVNTADQALLETLPGIGPTLAGRIIDYRDENGPFRSAEELLEVKGIGKATLEELRPHIALEDPGAGGNDEIQEDSVP